MKNHQSLLYILLIFFLISVKNGIAQEVLPYLPLALAYVDEELPENLSVNDRERIAIRLARLCDNSHFVASGEGHNFGIYPRIDIIEEATLEGLRKIKVLKLELSISVRQIVGGINFGTYYWTISGSGNSTSLALKSAFSNLPRSDARFAEFMNGIRPKIDAYYLANCEDIIQRADQLIITSQYEEAIVELIKVPTEASSCGERVQEKLQTAYDEYQRIHCGPMIQEAKALKARGKTNDALDMLLLISPNSSCAAAADALITRIGNNISQANQSKLQFAQEMYRLKKSSQKMQQQLKIQRWIGITEIAKTTAAAFDVFTPSINFPIYLGRQ